MLKNYLGLYTYKRAVESALSGKQKMKRRQFANCAPITIRKKKTQKIFFSGEKLFDSDKIYNCQNQGVWVVDRSDVDKRWSIIHKRKTKVPTKTSGVFRRFIQGHDTVEIDIGEITVDYAYYMGKNFPIPLKYDKELFGNYSIFQQDSVKPH